MAKLRSRATATDHPPLANHGKPLAVRSMFWPFPTKRTTPGQLLVLVGVVAALLLIGGILLICVSFGQPPENLDAAMEARWLGGELVLVSVVTGMLTWLGYRFIS